MAPQDFIHLVDRQSPALILYARQWCLAPEDVVQAAFFKLIAQRSTPTDLIAWLYRVVRNAAIDAGKADRRRERREKATARPERWFVQPEIEGLDADAAISALQHLPMDQREVIVARLWGDLSFEQIAKLASCSASTAFRRYSAGIDTLRKELGVPCPKTSPND